MHASYFGSSEKPLFGIYSPPCGRVQRDAVVLLCHPAPQEYMRSHWALRRLAARLADEGFHVFRFDYYATGDSAGDSAAGSLEEWRQNVVAALGEARDVSGVRRASVVGFGLGATLAAQAKVRVQDLVLWEPVVSGAAHLAALRSAHERQLAHNLQTPRLPRHGPLFELLGHPLPPALQAELETLELRRPFACAPARILLVAAEARPAYAPLIDAGSGSSARLETVPGEQTGDEPFLMWPAAERRICELLTGTAA